MINSIVTNIHCRIKHLGIILSLMYQTWEDKPAIRYNETIFYCTTDDGVSESHLDDTLFKRDATTTKNFISRVELTPITLHLVRLLQLSKPRGPAFITLFIIYQWINRCNITVNGNSCERVIIVNRV